MNEVGTQLIWLASYPRSGNSLARSVIEMSTNLKVHAYYDEGVRDIKLEYFLNTGGPIIAKTHELEHAANPARAIYVIRDGRDALVSYAHHLINHNVRRGPFEDVLAEIVDKPPERFRDWSYHIMTWMERDGVNAIVRYEDLVSEPTEVLEFALRHLGLGTIRVRNVPIPDFDHFQIENPLHYRRGIVGSHKDEMPPELIKRFTTIHRHTLERFGYDTNC